MSNRETIKEAIMEFRFSQYGGFDMIDDTKEDPDTCEWVDHLATFIDKAIKERIEKWIREETQ